MSLSIKMPAGKRIAACQATATTETATRTTTTASISRTRTTMPSVYT